MRKSCDTILYTMEGFAASTGNGIAAGFCAGDRVWSWICWGQGYCDFFYTNTVVGFVLTITFRTGLEGGFWYLKCHSGLL
jgi:hypothetical protein